VHEVGAQAALLVALHARDDDAAGFQSLEERTKRWSELFFK